MSLSPESSLAVSEIVEGNFCVLLTGLRVFQGREHIVGAHLVLNKTWHGGISLLTCCFQASHLLLKLAEERSILKDREERSEADTCPFRGPQSDGEKVDPPF